MIHNIKIGDVLTIVDNNASCKVLDIDEKSNIIAVNITLPDGTDLGIVKYRLSDINETIDNNGLKVKE